MSYRNLRKRQNECRDIDTLKLILEDALIELKGREKKLNSILEDNEVLSKECNRMSKVLMLIKRKRVNVFWLMECISMYHLTPDDVLKEYNKETLDEDDYLTKKDIDVLRRGLL